MKTYKTVSRRDFLKKAIVTTGLTVLGTESKFGKSLLIPETIISPASLHAILFENFAQSGQEDDLKSRFNTLQKYDWKEVFADSGTGNWQQKWFLDGDRAKVETGVDGMTIHAGPTYRSEADHAVLWTKDIFEAKNMKIEYNFTRIDTKKISGTVNIIYILAQGGGSKPLDILDWAHERKEPRMNYYYNFMDTYHVSYSTINENDEDNYVRGRRYMPSTGGALNGTELTPEYMNINLFEPGITYKMIFIKTEHELYFRTQGNGNDRVFFFDTTTFPSIDKGRIGLRQMYTRISRYSDFKVYTF